MITELTWSENCKRKDLPQLPEDGQFDVGRLEKGDVIELCVDGSMPPGNSYYELTCKVVDIIISFHYESINGGTFAKNVSVTQWVTLKPLWEFDEDMANDTSFIHDYVE